MRVSSFVVAVLGVIWPCVMSGQQVAPETYAPPLLTLERLMQEDPTFNGSNLWAVAADPASFRAAIEKQAASGKLLAQIFLGETYIPPECTFLPFKTAPADCPQDPLPKNLLGLTPSFDLAIHWLTLASEKGSGEASEILAQVLDRTIQSSTPSRYRMADVAHYHALARSQGFDLQDVAYSCYTLDRSYPDDRLIMAQIPLEFQFTSDELDKLHAAGASGTLRWRSTSIQPGLTTLLRHPEGPKIHTRVILSRPISHEMFAPMADRVDVVYLQQEDRIITVPSTYPAIRRKISFRPPTAGENTGAAFQEIDGRFAGGCTSPALP
jgi:hypothetical protein